MALSQPSGVSEQDPYVKWIFSQKVLPLDERKELEQGASDERETQLITTLQRPVVILQTTQTLRFLRDGNRTGYNHLLEAIPKGMNERREKLDKTILDLESQLADLFQALSGQENLDFDQMKEKIEIACLLMGDLSKIIRFKTGRVQRWEMGLAECVKQSDGDSLQRSRRKVERLAERPSEILSLLGKVDDLVSAIGSLGEFEEGGGSGIRRRQQQRHIRTLTEAWEEARQIYNTIRIQDQSDVEYNVDKCVTTVAEMLRIIETQIMVRGLLVHGQSEFLAEPDEKPRSSKPSLNGASRNEQDEVIIAHLRIVASLAKQMSRDEDEFEEMLAVGSQHLVYCARNHDPRKGGSLTTYMWPSLKGEMALVKRRHPVFNIPEHVLAQMKKLRKSIAVYYQTFCSRSSDLNSSMIEWVARDLKMTVHDVLILMRLHHNRLLSLESYVRDTHEDYAPHKEEDPAEMMNRSIKPDHVTREWVYLKDTLADPSDPEGRTLSSAHQVMLKARIDKVLKTLSYREREVIKLRYGLEDGYSYTLPEVGNIFRITRERVRQIEAKAVRKLQQPSRSQELVGFVD